MDEQENSQHLPPLEPTPWEKFLAIVKEEALWLAHALGVITVTLAIGRLIQRLGLDGSQLTDTTWEERVKKWLQPEKKR